MRQEKVDYYLKKNNIHFIRADYIFSYLQYYSGINGK